MLSNRIKNQLGYEWCDESTSKKIDAIIAQGQAYLKRYDPTADFENDEFAFLLLFTYCQYSLSNAVDDFGKNYAEEILSFYHAYLVKQSKEDLDADDV